MTSKQPTNNTTAMIKCEATICGTISRSATMRTSREGKPFMTFGVSVVLKDRKGQQTTVEVSVAADGREEDLADFSTGTRLRITGPMTFRRKDDVLYFNMRSVSTDRQTEDEDGITGQMTFRGSIGKSIDSRTDRKGKPYITFSAFSTEKFGEEFSFVWVKFIHFNHTREPWLHPGIGVDVKGTMDVTANGGVPHLGCQIESLSEWEKKPANTDDR